MDAFRFAPSGAAFRFVRFSFSPYAVSLAFRDAFRLGWKPSVTPSVLARSLTSSRTFRSACLTFRAAFRFARRYIAVSELVGGRLLEGQSSCLILLK